MKVEVLVSTMHQKDFSLIEKMNIKGDAVVINQTDKEEYTSIDTPKGKAKFLSTVTRGLSISRNAAIAAASGEVCLIADDDLVYEDNYIELVTEAYNSLPQADIIVFKVQGLNSERPERDFGNKAIRLRFRKSLQAVSYRISFKLASIKQNNIALDPIFGAGARFSQGEENIFMRTCLQKGLKAYYFPKQIASVSHEQSTWFKGYNEKFFNDLGAVYYRLFGKLFILFAFWFLLSKRSKYAPWISSVRALKSMIAGKKEYKRVRAGGQ